MQTKYKEIYNALENAPEEIREEANKLRNKIINILFDTLLDNDKTEQKETQAKEPESNPVKTIKTKPKTNRPHQNQMWTVEDDKLLTKLVLERKLSDKHTAEALGRTLSAIRARKHHLGLRKLVKIVWTPAMVAKIGCATDRRVAIELGITKAQVRDKRDQLGLLPYTKALATLESEEFKNSVGDFNVKELAMLFALAEDLVKSHLNKK